MTKMFSLGCAVILFLGIGCNQTEQTNNGGKKLPTTQKSVKERGIAYIENYLKINAAEDYGLEYFEEFITDDTIKDALFLVRRVGYAELKARKANVYNNYLKFGLTANENYIFIYNGKTKKFSTTAPIGASMDQPIEIDFQSITSLVKKDILVKYYILNSKFASYYTAGKESFYPVLNHPIYSYSNQDSLEAYAVKYEEGTFSLAKDIDLYKAVLANDQKEVTEENLVATEQRHLRFMFDPRKQKYVTPGVEELD